MHVWPRAVRRIALILVPSLGLSSPAAASGSGEPTVAPATTAGPESWLRRGAPLRARIDAEEGWTRGTFERVRNDSLLLWVPAGVTERRLVPMPLASIQRLELGREREPKTWMGFALGLLIAGAAGAVAVASDPDVGNETAGAAVGFAFYGGLGGLLGAVLGSSVQPDRWVAAAIPDAHGPEESRALEAHDGDRRAETGGER